MNTGTAREQFGVLSKTQCDVTNSFKVFSECLDQIGDTGEGDRTAPNIWMFTLFAFPPWALLSCLWCFEEEESLLMAGPCGWFQSCLHMPLSPFTPGIRPGWGTPGKEMSSQCKQGNIQVCRCISSAPKCQGNS